MEKQVISQIQTAVLAWYKLHGRHDLLWRNLEKLKIDVPYGVMVSEFMLQQTQVERVEPKYRAFLSYFPTIQKLSKATPALVVTLWSGLGYNRRAIMLRQSAKQIVDQYNGQVPDDPELLIPLPGIGEYAAAAIVAFGYNKPVAVIDTNIERFYELLFFGYAKPTPAKLRDFALQFIPQVQSREWHSALMDLMTLVRKAKTPKEQQTILLKELQLKPTWDLPVLANEPLKRAKQSPFKQSKRFFRGKTVAFLKDQKQHRAQFMELQSYMESIRLPKTYSYVEILTGLKKDGLVEFQEPIEKQTIIRLPN